MPDWPAVRAANGHPEPFACEYVQIGNEIWFKRDKVVAATGLADRDALAAWYVRVLRRYVEVVRAVAPEAKIVLDARFGDGIERTVLTDERVRAEVHAVTFHRYAPGQVGPVRRVKGRAAVEDVAPGALTADDWWYACSTMPAQVAPDGTTIALEGPAFDLAVELGCRVVCTEWNWNGWGFQEADAAFREEHMAMARALGAAGFIHGLMRQCATVELATQSMLLGHRWEIAALRVDPRGPRPPFLQPQGLAATLYNLHHGDRLLAVEHGVLPGRAQPFIVGKWTRWPDSAPTVAFVDLLATAGDGRVFVHVIQRHARDAVTVRVDLSDLGVGDATGVQWSLSGPPRSGATHAPPGEAKGRAAREACRVESRPATVADGVLVLALPPRTAHIVEVPLLRPAWPGRQPSPRDQRVPHRNAEAGRTK
jgi:hypothetical protein